MNKYLLLLILPFFGICFFALTYQEMQNTERAILTLYSEHLTLIEESIAHPSLRENLTKTFAEKIPNREIHILARYNLSGNSDGEAFWYVDFSGVRF